MIGSSIRHWFKHLRHGSSGLYGRLRDRLAGGQPAIRRLRLRAQHVLPLLPGRAAGRPDAGVAVLAGIQPDPPQSMGHRSAGGRAEYFRAPCRGRAPVAECESPLGRNRTICGGSRTITTSRSPAFITFSRPSPYWCSAILRRPCGSADEDGTADLHGRAPRDFCPGPSMCSTRLLILTALLPRRMKKRQPNGVAEIERDDAPAAHLGG